MLSADTVLSYVKFRPLWYIFNLWNSSHMGPSRAFFQNYKVHWSADRQEIEVLTLEDSNFHRNSAFQPTKLVICSFLCVNIYMCNELIKGVTSAHFLIEIVCTGNFVMLWVLCSGDSMKPEVGITEHQKWVDWGANVYMKIWSSKQVAWAPSIHLIFHIWLECAFYGFILERLWSTWWQRKLCCINIWLDPELYIASVLV